MVRNGSLPVTNVNAGFATEIRSPYVLHTLNDNGHLGDREALTETRLGSFI